MLLDPTDFRFVAAVRAGHEVFAREFAGLSREDFVPWPDRGAYGGDWLTMPLMMREAPPDIMAICPVNQARCPGSTAWLRSIPGVVSAGFSWMEPGCHIYPHVDTKPKELLRAHLALEVPPGPVMRVADEVYGWEEGECILFDGYVRHETANKGTKRRVVLLVDAFVSDEEFARLSEWRRLHGVAVPE